MQTNNTPLRPGIDWDRAQALLESERTAFEMRNPLSKALSLRASQHLMFGVPLHWMNDWGTPFALQVEKAQGVTLTDADGHTLLDFCLGDTGAMFGHSPKPVADALRTQADKGYTTMLAGEDAAVVGELLSERFGLSHWQFAMTATDANRFVLRWLRAASGKKKLLVFNGCYHGTVDDVFVDLVDGVATQRDSLLGQVYDLTGNTVVIEFNDLVALEQALARGDVACLLAEPAMTNIGMVLPEPGYWEAAQKLCNQYGVALVLDETHTISCGPGGYTRAYGLQPDAIVLGKPVGGGVPCAVYGFNDHWAAKCVAAKRDAPHGHSGIGTTLTGNMLAMAAMRAALTHLMTPSNYAHMLTVSGQLAEGLRKVIADHQLPWCVTQLGARSEFQFRDQTPRTGTEAGNALDADMEHLIHLALLNRGIMITPFHNMLLVSPETTAAHVEQLLRAFGEVLGLISA
jgi:glutamate-1-semialdehyde 2,1-aminomutase